MRLNKKIPLVIIMVLFFSSLAYSDYSYMDLDSDLIIGKWRCVKQTLGSMTPFKYLEFYKDLSLDVVVGNCEGRGGEYLLMGVDTIELKGFEELAVTEGDNSDPATLRMAKEILSDVRGFYQYKFSPSGNELTLIDKRNNKYELVREEQ